MTNDLPPKNDPLARLAWPVRLTRWGMVAEELARHFWPFATVVMALIAAWAFRVYLAVPAPVLAGGGVLAAALLAWTLLQGLKRFSLPSRAAAEARLDGTIPGHPISTLRDNPAIGQDDPASQAVWQAHLARMAARLRGARAPAPDLRVSKQDRFALRLMAATALTAALIFGVFGENAEIGPIIGPSEAATAGPSWEGWIEPPLYTGKPALYLNDITRDSFEAPVGSRVTMRFYGSDGVLSLRQTVSETPLPEGGANTDAAQTFFLDQSGEIAVEGPDGRVWEVSALADQPPSVVFDGELTGHELIYFQMPFTVTDDHAVLSGRAIIRLNAAAADRRYGLAVEPEPREPLIFDLPMPYSGSRSEFTEVLLENASEHAFANLPVTISLEVTDHAGQIGTTTESFSRLPAARFFDPLANALIEMRRDLLWSRENARRSEQILRALTWQAEAIWENEEAYRLTRRVIALLETGDSLSTETRDEIAEILWMAALLIEDGDLEYALDRLRRAQERLEEAMRQGASDEEIAQLMEELREAMNDYMRELAENAEAPQTDQPDQSGDSMEMSMADLEDMMRRIEELIQEGRMAEAMELMEQLRQMMENMQVTQGEGDGPPTPGQQAMEGLQDTLRDQQDLSDDAFRELQDQFNPGQQQGQQQQGQQGQPGGGGQGQDGSDSMAENGTGQGGENDGRSLAERQQELLRQLQEQAQNLPGLSSESAEQAEELLDDAGRAMDEAADALGEGELADALDSQSEAMEALREGMGELGRALAEAQGLEEPGQGQARSQEGAPTQSQDPLGRDMANNGSPRTDELGMLSTDEDVSRRAGDLLDELRRRSAEQNRPDAELDYLRRLLEQF